MFFSGDPSTRKRVDLGGRSSKERDRQKLLEQTRLERNRRLWLRQQNSAALKIQKCFRGRKAVKAEHFKAREHFYETYGKHCQNVNRHCFGPDSEFLRQLLFFFNAQNAGDFAILVETCRLLLQFVRDSGNIAGLFAGKDYSSNRTLVDYRVKQLAYACIQAVHQNRNWLEEQVLMSPEESSTSTSLLLETVVLLINPKLPWACNIVGYLLQRNTFTLFREIALTWKESTKTGNAIGTVLSLEHVLGLIIPHVGQKPCTCPNTYPQSSFSSQILTIPFLWQLFPYLKEVFASRGLSQHYIHQMAFCMQNSANILPNDVSAEYPSYACLLGNILETAGVALSQPNCSFEMAVDLAAVTTFLLETLPSMKSSSRESKESSMLVEDDTVAGDEAIEIGLNKDLERQICNAIDPRFLLQLTNLLFGGISLAGGSHDGPDDKEVAAVGAACAFLHVTFNTLPLERIMTVLAYRTELVPVLWNFMKRCHENQKWSSLSQQFAYLSGDAPGWLLPLAVFCPVYKHMLMIVDNEEFYEQEKPLSLKDIRCLIIILRQALWQLLWINPATPANSVKLAANTSTNKRHPEEFIQERVSVVASVLLSQLQDWNNRRQFTSPSDFHADGVNEFFISQALIENTRANDILKQAPFLVPFTSRVKIFTSQLTAVRQRQESHSVFTRNRFRIRRDHILEDAYNQMSALSEEDLRGVIRVTFVNEFGVEEAGIDGGGIFKDFMENITRAAFDVQYGLFKETADHLLYPNPGSGMIHEQHLQFFHFLGSLLAKAMFEGILVDIPFATFFLSKLKQKYNYLNDLPSLDPELYRHLIFLKWVPGDGEPTPLSRMLPDEFTMSDWVFRKHYEGDISDLELYFVIVNNEYGEQTEEELLPGGKNLRVSNENVITFIHLVANHRLNFQIRQQSSHFLRGFQQLIQKDWIDMFNEHELQLLISGSVDSLDVDDLRLNTNYVGGYHKEHYIVEMFWEVLKSFSLENQKKFLKFVTGCSRGPLLGFRYLEPLFCIQRAAGIASEEALDRLPTSATCMNLLKLPPYRSKEQLETKLLYAINADAGFDLS
ncbi:E3 ubiquitin-protein ligase UPL6 isoform X2 [Juglans microcarpa x Juglans regia]|uniref:E3 ubiquitin-protein ligase UPL6 isoform X2 n=1 Tax=Juglans microcarpa x Juglans regia TaxID=2249226 RepID=UPI001B7D947C|nr:E3 ubiquitin-protein ligase UPL6 isoform X2 [Juglans microcarpa x Juglans regia]